MIILRKQKEYSTHLEKGLAGFNKTILRKSPMQAKRAAIIEERKILTPFAKPALKVSKAIENGNLALNQLATNPGEVINKKVIQPSIEAPITSLAMKAVPVPGSSALIGIVGKPEKTMWKRLGVGDKMSKAANKYTTSKGGKYVEGAINGVVNTGKIMLNGF